MNIQVEYKDTAGTITNHTHRLTRLAFAKHLAIAGQIYAPRPQKIIRTLAMFFHYSGYIQRQAFNSDRFSEPPIQLSDPTEKGQFSNLAGKAIADFLSKRIDQSIYTVNYEAAMRMHNPPIPLNHLYRALRADSTLMATSPVLQNFYVSSQTTVRETLASIDDKLSDGNIISSQNDVTALNPQNNIEANYKVFYSSYLNYLNDTLSSTDSTNILTLANGCPTVDGAIVYNARALYNSIYSVVEQFTDNCTSSAQGSRLGNFSGVQKWDADKKPFDAIMYPVPSSGDVNISPIGIIEGNLKVIVLDITGKVVFDKALQITNGLCNFKLNLNTGTYLVKIINSNTNESINKKLIMQK